MSGEEAQGASDAGQDAAKKGLEAAKNLAKDAKEVGKLAASAGTDVSAWIKLAKRWLPPIIVFIVVVSLIATMLVFVVIAGVMSAITGNKSATCSTGATDIALLATNGPVNVGDRVTDPVYGGSWTYGPKEAGNAQLVVQAGLNHKNEKTGAPEPIPPAGIIIAIATIFVEDHMLNSDNDGGGGSSSVGLFQQIKAEGSWESRMDPTQASARFYNLLLGLKPPWNTRVPGDAAQAVQRSGHPDRYQKAIGLAAGITMSILDAINKNKASTVSDSSSVSNHPLLASAGFLNINQRIGQSAGPSAPTDSAPPGSVTTPSATPASTNPDCTMGDAGSGAGGAFGTSAGATGFEPGPNGVQVPVATVAGIGRINATIAVQVTNMLAKAKADGVNLTGGSYRAHADQIRLRTNHCGSSHYAIWEMPSSSCSPPTARPGRSQHELGLAIDFENCSPSSACFRWLKGNAGQFGLINLPSESWHWSTTGN